MKKKFWIVFCISFVFFGGLVQVLKLWLDDMNLLINLVFTGGVSLFVGFVYIILSKILSRPKKLSQMNKQ